MYTNSRENEVRLLKQFMGRASNHVSQMPPSGLVHLHKKAKKSNIDWKCPACGEIYRTINMLSELPGFLNFCIAWLLQLPVAF